MNTTLKDMALAEHVAPSCLGIVQHLKVLPKYLTADPDYVWLIYRYPEEPKYNGVSIVDDNSENYMMADDDQFELCYNL